MKIKYCTRCWGTGKVPDFWDETKNIICPRCNGSGKEPQQTNEEWFSGMYTEAKAEWLADHMKCSKCPQQNRCNGYHGGCVALILEWLKQPHTNKE